VTSTTGIHIAGVGGVTNNSGQPVPVNDMISVDAIFARARETPIHADIRKVNAIPVTGQGAPDQPWGPA
jgi:hypothetical protein